eukprot:TRINITY_DN11370_c0_g1_i1.p1 TRINITY_DN11370_c0_g1~~TRINITY_DN11370_c0_g1_i1.p1  ORF type:complete len:398 (+),score=28.73 TRINITY_DN11370_c0_g1_i1:167-1360(+)
MTLVVSQFVEPRRSHSVQPHKIHIADRLYYAVIPPEPDQDALPVRPDELYFDIAPLARQIFCGRELGPVNLSNMYRFWCELDPQYREHASKRIVCWCFTTDSELIRLNAAFLICTFAVVLLQRSPEYVQNLFKSLGDPALEGFLDFTENGSFRLTIADCLQGLQVAIESRVFMPEKFDVSEYDYYNNTLNGHINVILPRKFLAFPSPFENGLDSHGNIAFRPSDYFEVFREFGISTVVRLNESSTYNKTAFTRRGIEHYDLYFDDCSCPSLELVQKFFEICDRATGMIAIHCRAGLGRTGTCIALYMMNKLKWSARQTIAWLRLCRPGSVMGPQQEYLTYMEPVVHSNYFDSPAHLPQQSASKPHFEYLSPVPDSVVSSVTLPEDSLPSLHVPTSES